MSTFNIAKNSISGINALVSTLNYVPPFNEHGKQILEPLNCMIKLALLSFKQKNTKISICNNRIDYQTFNLFQGAMRWTNGDKRSDLHNLYEPIKKALKWYNIYNKKISFIFNLSINGLKALKQTYQDENTNNSNLVCHSLAYYINIITTTLMKLELDFRENKNTNNTRVNIDDNEQKNNSDSVEVNNNKSKKKKKKKNKKISNNIPINIDNSNAYDKGKQKNSFIDDECGNDFSSDEENKLKNNIDNIQSDIKNLYDSLNNESENEYDYNNKDNIKSRKYNNQSKHDGYKLSNIWIEKEIDIIYHTLTLIYEKYNNKENYDYLLESIECILREKDERVYSIIQKISTSLGK